MQLKHLLLINFYRFIIRGNEKIASFWNNGNGKFLLNVLVFLITVIIKNLFNILFLLQMSLFVWCNFNAANTSDLIFSVFF